MRAITYAEYGGPDVLTLTELPEPTAGPGQVVVRVGAWGINPFDTKVRAGAFAGDKPFGAPKKVGRDFAGEVVEVGPDVDLTVGTAVVGSVAGASAELVVAKAAALVTVDPPFDAITAAAIPGAGTAAIRALRLSGVQPGQTLLVHAAAGGVGTFLVQLARAAGITVVGTAGPANQDHVSGFGVIPVVYGEGWQERVRRLSPGPIDAVVDAAGRGVAEQSLDVVVPGGRIVTLVDFDAKGPGIITTDGSEPGFENSLAEAAAAVASGRVRIEVDSLHPFAQYRRAHERSETGHARGKVVVIP